MAFSRAAVKKFRKQINIMASYHVSGPEATEHSPPGRRAPARLQVGLEYVVLKKEPVATRRTRAAPEEFPAPGPGRAQIRNQGVAGGVLYTETA